jgi:2-dehydrotetronate isomerase
MDQDPSKSASSVELMIRLAANLTYLFTELPFLERFAAAASAGFRAVEYNFAYDVSTQELAARLLDNGLILALVNTPPGNEANGELGLAVLPGRERDTATAFAQALSYAVALDAKLIHFLAGKPPEGSDKRAVDELFLKNLCSAADLAAKEDRTLTLEPLNRRDRPGYHLNSNSHARALIAASGRDNVKLQLDLYHCQISEGDLMKSIERDINLIAHVQIAGVPERSEPNVGEIAYANVLAHLDSLGYTGYVGCEYWPRADTLGGLGWAAQYLETEAVARVRL